MKLFGIIGKPLDHSLSPRLYNYVFRKLSLNHRYLPFQVEKSHLKNLVLCMKLIDLEGMNVTAPYKEAVIPYLDGLDKSAREAQAVNTIVRRRNRFIGYNTDGLGFLKALTEKKGISPKKKEIVIIGAGGAARGVAAALGRAKAKKIVFLNRHPKRARRAARFFQKTFPKIKWEGFPFNQKSCLKVFPRADILIQTTPSLVRLDLKRLPKGALIADLLYPKETPLLKEAKKRNLKRLDGRWMFLYQAHYNLALWIKRKIDFASLRRSVSKDVRGVSLKNKRGLGN